MTIKYLDDYLPPVRRNQTLERLELYQCTLLFSTDIASAPALKQLTLAVVKVGRAWLQGLSNALPCLEELIFDCCTDLDKVDEASITPSRTLKCAAFLALAVGRSNSLSAGTAFPENKLLL